MSRTQHRPAATRQQELVLLRETCESCGGTLWMAYRSVRTITTLEGVCQLFLTIRRCHNHACERYRQPCRPEEEGHWALPHGEFGLDIIALVGTLRYEQHQSVPETHQELSRRGVIIAERTVTNLLARYKDSPKQQHYGQKWSKDMPGCIVPLISSLMMNATQLLRYIRPMKRS